MVDVSDKQVTRRRAVAECFVMLEGCHLEALSNNPKGDVLAIAQVAGIQAAKRTSELIPLCHNLPLETVQMNLAVESSGVRITAETVAEAKTGVEMEAITAVSIAALTLYDMLKSAGHGITIQSIRLIQKSGGKQDYKA